MKKILFEDATLTSQAKVTIDGVDHLVTEAEYSGGTGLNAETFNLLQDNVENAIDEANTPINLIPNGEAVRTNEKIDGKWVYKKRLQFTTEVKGGVTNVPHGITGYHLIWIDSESHMRSGTLRRSLPMLYYSSATKDSVDVGISGDNIQFIADTPWSTNWIKEIVIKYTKTTD